MAERSSGKDIENYRKIRGETSWIGSKAVIDDDLTEEELQ